MFDLASEAPFRLMMTRDQVVHMAAAWIIIIATLISN